MAELRFAGCVEFSIKFQHASRIKLMIKLEAVRKEPPSTGCGGTKIVRNAFFDVKTIKKPLMPIVVD